MLDDLQKQEHQYLKNVVINDIMIELLCINIDLSENLFSLINPFVIKML